MTPFLAGLEKLVLVIVVLGLVISWHELGHFLVAKLSGVKVEVFSFGIGNRLFGVKIGETDYRVSAIPLGGYVRMAGEASAEPDEPPRPPAPRDFEAKSIPVRLAIMAAGPAFNLIGAVGLMTIAFLAGVDAPAYLQEPPRVGEVQEGSPAADAGLQPGDLIVAVAGVAVPKWETALAEIALRPGARATLDVERAGQRLALPVTIATQGSHRLGWIGVTPCTGITLGPEVKDPAKAAGMQGGDVIVSVGGVAPCSPESLVARIQEAEGAPLEFVLLRDGQEVRVASTASFDNGRWRVGISPRETSVVRRFGLTDSVKQSLEWSWEQSTFLFTTLSRLLTFRLSVRSMSGPMELADFAAEAKESGLVSLLSLMALISLNLGIFNLLPVPVLDGGRIAILLVEGAIGHSIGRREKEWILMAGVAMIVVLMVVVIFFDVIKKLEG